MYYRIEWDYPVLPASNPPPKKSVVGVRGTVSIIDLPAGGANVEFTDVSGAAPEVIAGYVDGKPGSYHGDFPHPGGNRRYIFTATVAKGFISGIIFRYGPAEDSGGHWGGR